MAAAMPSGHEIRGNVSPATFLERAACYIKMTQDGGRAAHENGGKDDSQDYSY